MLNERHVHPTLPVADLERARGFYEEPLGYTPQLVSPEGVQYPGFSTVNSVANTPAGRAVWFNDTEGNIIGLFESAARA